MLDESDSWVRLMAVKGDDVVVLKDSKGLSELLLVDVWQSCNSSLLALLLKVIEKVAVLEPLCVNFLLEIFL